MQFDVSVAVFQDLTPTQLDSMTSLIVRWLEQATRDVTSNMVDSDTGESVDCGVDVKSIQRDEKNSN